MAALYGAAELRCRSAAGAGPVTRYLMERLPDLVLVQTLSDGYESVDVQAATELGIRVSYAPGDVTGNADSVAEYAVLLMLATARRLNVALASIRDHSIKIPGRGRALIGANVCIVGTGSIRAKIAHRLLIFGVNLTGVDLLPAIPSKHTWIGPCGCNKKDVCRA